MRFDPLPKGLVLGKPLKPGDYDEKEILELEKQGKLIITRKYDGYKLIVVIGKKEVKIYTAGISLVDSRLDHLKTEMGGMGFPPRTILVGEGIMGNGRGEDFGKVVKVFKSSLEEALKFQALHGRMEFVPFDILAFDGTILKEPFTERLDRIWSHHFTKREPFGIFPSSFVLPWCIRFEKKAFEQSKQDAIINDWEGLVLYSSDFVNTFRLDGGNPPRPKGCYKWKPTKEDDFIVNRWITDPKNPGRIKEVVLSQIDSATGEWLEYGKLGTFDAETRKKLKTMEYPFVMQVAFEMHFSGSGKLRHARFVRFRPDKSVNECVAPVSFAPAT